MTSNSMRSFAGGLIVAASICGAVYFFGSGEAKSIDTTETKESTETTETIEKVSVDEMKTLLSAEGYVIHTEEEWSEQLSAAETANNENKEQKETEEKVVYHTMLSVSSGMTSIDVGRALEQTNIIDDAFAFSQEIDKRGIANKLRPGMFEVESGMSLDEVISVIFQ
ncbi:hypothetical protein JMM81_14335 [Bacillus sp. V3B]|uniref:endolytic transglycosylase MltG n=1 Tax=Bacillus sp. V3B TaxID=2804915 RepID=UPI00210E117F|nr:endolytic transglycosylase MltG [Bacillus sp. V3B]MCQ6276103.1 hypothetical protein [Bacillus sp. V3B]